MFAAALAAAAFCAECHSEIAERHGKSHHAQALRHIEQTDLAAQLADQQIAELDGAQFEYTPATRGVRVTASLGGNRATAMLEWVFGAGAQGRTFVGRLDSRYIEHRISFYPPAARFARTFGHPAGPSATASLALGLPQTADTMYRCFNCHAYGVKPGPDLSAIRPGVTCQRCHGSGAQHVAAARTGRAGREGVRTPARSPARAVIAFCAECHRSPAEGTLGAEAPDLATTRFAPIGLLASRCFRRSGKLSCLTCHDPHANARARGDEHYRRVCVACHQQVSAASGCPRNSDADCIRCHMRETRLSPNLKFTNHQISR